jgi:rare lipoprotein A
MSDQYFFANPGSMFAPPPMAPPPPPPIDYGLPAGISYAPSTNLQTAASSGANTAAFNAGQANMRYGAQNTFNAVTGPLTQDPAKYAAIGAAYGRAAGNTPTRGGGGSVFDTGTSAIPSLGGPFQSAQSGGGVGSSAPTGSYVDPFNTPSMLKSPYSAAAAAASLPSAGSVTGGGSASAGVAPPPPPVDYSSLSRGLPFQSAQPGGGVGSAAPTAPYQGSAYGGRDAITQLLMRNIKAAGSPLTSTPGGGGSGTAGPMPTAPPPPSDTFADRFGAAPKIFGGLQPALGPQLPREIMDPQAPPASPPSSPPNPADLPRNIGSQFGALPDYDPNSFANRFAAGGFFKPGVPSQFYTGDRYGGPSALPPGYTPPFSVDNPQGALPGAPFTPPVSPPSQDTLSPGDRGIGFKPPIMNFDPSGGSDYTPPFNDPSYFPHSMRDFTSPPNDYNSFQQNQPPPVVGTASTYDPTKPGWQTGGMETASGATYNPNAFSAAIQTSLRDRFGGVKYGQPATNALVEAPGGQQAVVGVNDVGPLVQNRVIDLSTPAMKYFNPFATPNSGLMPNMRVTPYYGGAPPGPVGPVGPTGPMPPTPGVPPPSPIVGMLPPYTPTTGFVRR